MGISYYNCKGCDSIFDCYQNFEKCCICNDKYCGYCEELGFVPLNCESAYEEDCNIGIRYDNQTDDEGSDIETSIESETGTESESSTETEEHPCVCHKKIKELYKNGCDSYNPKTNYHDKNHKNHKICTPCNSHKDPYEINDSDLLSYLCNIAKFKTVDEARAAARKEMKINSNK